MSSMKHQKKVWSMFKVDKTAPEQHYWRRFGVFIVNFKHISYLLLVFLFLFEQVNVCRMETTIKRNDCSVSPRMTLEKLHGFRSFVFIVKLKRGFGHLIGISVPWKEHLLNTKVAQNLKTKDIKENRTK